jgi:signal transduction histidine kinase/CheY-like chemotaxis protein
VEQIIFKSSAKTADFTSLCYSHDRKIWLGSADGLFCYNLSDYSETLFSDKSIEKDRIINLIEDSKGNIWGSTNSSILKFTPASEEFEFYPVGNELPLSHFESNSCMIGSDGSLYFTDLDGFVRFLPENVVKSNYQSPIRITTLSVQNQLIEPGVEYQGKILLHKPIAFSNSLTLEYENRSFALGFSTLQFGNREGIRYAYKLEGIDPDWNYSSESKELAIYTRVPSGNYLFRVKGTNADGVWNAMETTLQIKIRPPFWAGPIFIVIYLVLIVGLTFAIFYYYSNKLKWQNELRIIRLEKDHSEEMNHAKMQFFTNIFHEFRTPLSLIVGPLEKLARNTSLDNAAKTLVNLTSNNAQRLIRLNNQLLDFRQLENKKVNLKISGFDFIEFARTIYLLFTDKASRKEIAYSFETDTELLMVTMDAEKVETILFNLLSNAFKFTNKGGSVSLSVTQCSRELEQKTTDCLCLVVRDTGIGIAEEDQKRIFERYFQSDESLRMERGSGIGLTLVEEYVNMHSGEITLKSEPAKGTEFRIFLPLKHAREISTPIRDYELKPDLPSVPFMNGASQNPVILPGKPLVLLVEDDKDLLDFMVLSLKGKYNILTANGEDALRKIEKNIPDLIVTDILMPGMDGLTMIKKLKKNQRTAHIPVIILSAQAENADQLEGLKSGADAYMIKPFEIEHLEARIGNFIFHGQQLTKHLKTDKSITPGMKETLSGDEKLLRKIISAIGKNLSDPELSVEKLCKEIGLSPSVISRKVKNLTGLKTIELIRKIKLQQAEQLLKTKKFTVAEVMDQVGFSNHSYFSKCFRKLYRMSPREYMDKL